MNIFFKIVASIVTLVVGVSAISGIDPRETECYYWHDYSESDKSCFLSGNEVSEYSKEIYFHHRFSDDDAFFSTLDSIISDNVGIKRAFYFHLFTIIIDHSDGAAAEPIGQYAINLLKNDPDYVLNYYREHVAQKNRFACDIAVELYYQNSVEEYVASLKQSVYSNLSDKRALEYFDSVFIKTVLYYLSEITLEHDIYFDNVP